LEKGFRKEKKKGGKPALPHQSAQPAPWPASLHHVPAPLFPLARPNWQPKAWPARHPLLSLCLTGAWALPFSIAELRGLHVSVFPRLPRRDRAGHEHSRNES